MLTKNVFGVDLGTSAVKIYSLRKNRLLSEHDMIAIKDGSQVIAVGNDAWEMYEKNPPGIVIDRPILDGRIADVAEVEMLLRLLFRKTDRRTAQRPVIFFSAPVNMSEIEKRAYYAISYTGEFRKPGIYLVDRPVCDALSLGIPISRTRGSMILDIGAESTEVSVISQDQVIVSDHLRIGGQDLDDAITGEIRRSLRLLIGNRTARRLKTTLATFELEEEETRKVTGIDTLSGLPREVEVSSRLVSSAVSDELARGATEMKAFLERTPPQIRDSITSEGVYLTGGTSRIPGIDTFLKRILGCRVNISSNYEFSTIRGLEELIKNRDLKKWTYTIGNRR